MDMDAQSIDKQRTAAYKQVLTTLRRTWTGTVRPQALQNGTLEAAEAAYLRLVNAVLSPDTTDAEFDALNDALTDAIAGR